jgi:hypothetical protein
LVNTWAKTTDERIIEKNRSVPCGKMFWINDLQHTNVLKNDTRLI